MNAILSEDVKRENLVIDLLRSVRITIVDFNDNVTFNQGSIVLKNESTVEVTKATTKRMTKRAKLSICNVLKYLLVGLSVLIGFVCIMQITLHYYKKVE